MQLPEHSFYKNHANSSPHVDLKLAQFYGSSS